MINKKKQKDLFPGFNKLMIRDVPQGSIICSENIKEYPFKESGSYLSEDKGLIIQPEEDNQWRLIPTNHKTMLKFQSLWEFVKGDVGYINTKVKEYYAKL